MTKEELINLDAALSKLKLDVLANDSLTASDVERLIKLDIPRAARGFKNFDIAIATPCAPGRSVTEESLGCISRGMAYDHGILPISTQSFEVANNREILLERVIEGGFRKLLFLDADTVIDWSGVEQLATTMKQWRCAMVSALVFQRYIGADGVFNAFFNKGDGKFAPVTKADIPDSLTAFPATSCGLAAALLDLEQIKEKPGPRFKRVAEGRRHYGEDIAFCDWLKRNDMDFVIDPKVRTVHAVNHRFQYEPPSVKTG